MSSVLGQLYRDFEIIVVDDGSTDDTVEAIWEIGDVIRFVRQENRGPAAARNAGAALSTGQYLAFLDSDDRWNPDFLARHVALLQSAPESVVCSVANALRVDRQGTVLGSTFDLSPLLLSQECGILRNACEILASRNLLFTQCSVVCKSAFRDVGGFNEDLRMLEDYDLALRLSARGDFAYIKTPLLTYLTGADDSLTTRAYARRGEVDVVLHRVLLSFANSRPERVSRKALRQVHLRDLSALVSILGHRLAMSSRITLARVGRAFLFLARVLEYVRRRLPGFPDPIVGGRCVDEGQHRE